MFAKMSGERVYEIHEVAQLTGMQPARLRVWERRYAVVRPARQANGYRAYSAEQVALLRAFARLIGNGVRIGDLVARPVEEVLAQAEGRDRSGSPQAMLLDAIKAFDREALESLVAQQIALRGLRGFAESVVVPLAQDVGDLWALGRLPVSAEHLASEVIVHALKGGLRAARSGRGLIVCACLPEERHEWGILTTAATLQEGGWRVQYLGPDLPVPDLLEAVWKLRPEVVGISANDPVLVERQLPALGAMTSRLPPRVRVVVGGSGMAPHASLLRTHGYSIGIASLAAEQP